MDASNAHAEASEGLWGRCGRGLVCRPSTLSVSECHEGSVEIGWQALASASENGLKYV